MRIDPEQATIASRVLGHVRELLVDERARSGAHLGPLRALAGRDERAGAVCRPWRYWTNDFTSYGLTASVLPVRSIPIAVFLVLQAGIGRTAYDTSNPSIDYSAATFGLAYQQ